MSSSWNKKIDTETARMNTESPTPDLEQIVVQEESIIRAPPIYWLSGSDMFLILKRVNLLVHLTHKDIVHEQLHAGRKNVAGGFIANNVWPI